MSFSFLLFVAFPALGRPIQVDYDFVVFKDMRGTTHAILASSPASKVMNMKVGEWINGGAREVLQKIVDSFPKGCRILIKRGMYDLGEEALEVPTPSHFVIEGEGFDPFPEVLQQFYKDSWSFGGTCLVYRGKGSAISVVCRGEEKIKLKTSFELINIAIRLKENAESAVRLENVDYAIFEGVGIGTDKRSQKGISIKGKGKGTKFLQCLLIKGPFEIGLDLDTKHVTVLKAEIEGYRKYGIMLGEDCKVISAVVKTDSKEARAGVRTYPFCKGGVKEETSRSQSESSQCVYWSTVINVFDESHAVSRNYVPFVADRSRLVLVGCGKSPFLETRLYCERGGGKIDDRAQALKEPRR